MTKDQRVLLLTNLIGGSAVICSYVWGLVAHPGTANLLWGNISSGAIPVYAASMILGALGYFLFTSYLLFFCDPNKITTQIRAGFRGFSILYLLILVPSALWMPLTYAMLASPSGLIWFCIRLVLMLVGLGGLGLVSALLSLRPRSRPLLAAIIGCCFFCFQTAFVDALIWPNYFALP